MAVPVEVVLSAKDEASAVFDSASASLGGLTTLAAGAAAAGLAAGAVAVGAVGKAALDMSGDIDQATDDVATKLGIAKSEAEGFESVMTGVFANNFGEDFEDISSSVVTLQSRLGDLIDTQGEAGQAALEASFALRDAFGVETEETLSAVQSLMENFGVTSDEAFDLVTAGFQRGLDRSGDFLDTVNEYSTQFSNAGADAGQFFSALETGLEGGVLGTDKIADSFKEFRLRINNLSEAQGEALVVLTGTADSMSNNTEEIQLATIEMGKLEAKLLGAKEKQAAFNEKTKESTRLATETKIEELTLKYNEQKDAVEKLTESHGVLQEGTEGFIEGFDNVGSFMESIRDGSLSSADAFNLVTEALTQIEDPTLRMQVGAELLGTQFEDLGDSMLANLDLGATSLEDLAGSTETLNQQYDNLGSVVEGTWRTFLVGLQPATDGLLELANDAMPHVEDFISGTLTPAIEVLVLWLSTGLPDAIKTVSDFWSNTLMPAMQPVEDFISGTLVPIFEKLEDVLVGNSVHTAIETVADFFTETLIPAAEKVEAFFSDTVIPLFEELEQMLRENAQKMSEEWETNLSDILGTAETVWSTVQEVTETTINTIKEVVDTVAGELVAVWDEHGEQIKEIATLAWTLIEEVITEVTETIQQIIDLFTKETGDGVNVWVEFLKDTISLAWAAIEETIDFALDQIQNVIELAIALLQGDWKQAWDEVEQIVERSWELIETAVKNAGTLLVNAVKDVMRKVVKEFKDVDFTQIGKDMMGGVVSGIRSMAGSVADAAKNTAQGALDKVKFWQKSDSPSRLWHDEVGVSIGEGIELGILSMADRIEAAALGVVQQATSAAQGELDQFLIGLGVTPLGSTAAAGVEALRSIMPGSGVSGDAQVSPGTELFMPIPAGSGQGGTTIGGFAPPRGDTVVHFNGCNFNGTDRDAAHKFGNELAQDLRRECGF